MMIAVTNQKGGIGKTTTVLNLGAIAALEGQKTCLIDLDPQANLTKTLAQPQDSQPTLYNALNYSTPVQEILLETSIKNLTLLPARNDLASFERTGAADSQLPYRLRKVIEPIQSNFDLIMIDTPPTLGALTVNAMTTASRLLIPIQPSYLPLQGTNDLTETYRQVKARLNPALELLGVLITMYDPRTTLGKEAITEIWNAFGDKVFATVIRRSVKIEESPASGQSVVTYAPKSQAAGEYLRAYRELMQRV